MISKNKIRHIKSLSIKKFRDSEGLFVAEGEKLVRDLSDDFDCESLILTAAYSGLGKMLKATEILEASTEDMERMSAQKSPQGVLAVFRKKETLIEPQLAEKDLVLMLDDIQDPGNLGTIIRIADWFGIRNIVCSEHTADLYNPKTVQATMGAMSRVNVIHTSLTDWLNGLSKDVPVYGTFLDGESVYTKKLAHNGVIVMGNEGNGISDELARHIGSRLLIPSYPAGITTSESLNVGVATAIICAEFRRRSES